MKKIIYGLLMGSAVLCSCTDDYLNEEPKLSQSTELTLSTLDGLQKAIIGAYSPLSSASWYGSSFITFSEMKAGNARIPANPDFQSGRCTTEYNWTFANTSTQSGLWSYAYYTIANANNILDNADGKGTDGEVNGIKAEALFLRAVCYFDLVRTFGQPYTQVDPTTSLGVPIMLHAVVSEPARNTVAEVYDQIIADLTEAEAIIPDDYNTTANYHTSVTDLKNVASKEAIQGLLSRVYLYHGDYQKAADYATKVIDSKKFTLYTEDNYTTVWNQATGGSEVIFEVYVDETNYLWGYAGYEYLCYLSDPKGYADFAVSHDLYDLYADSDVRKKLFTTTTETPDQYWTLKYAGKDSKTPSYCNTVYLRLAEMYLNRAEATLRGANSGVSAQVDMNTLAASRGATAEAATLDGVFTERRKELAFEGHIFYDFARCGKSITRVDTDAALKTIEFPSYRWAMPIGKSEMDANPNMVQNPGY